MELSLSSILVLSIIKVAFIIVGTFTSALTAQGVVKVGVLLLRLHAIY
jgi:multisubunit Na+/H+ antiporter MnhG subunit